MFWSRGAREARRQKVLDELMELDPADRRLRLEQAVVAGDVRSKEVDQALRLVARLDALRVMTLPAVDGTFRRAIPACPGTGTDAPQAAELTSEIGLRRDEQGTTEDSTDWKVELPGAAELAPSARSRSRARRTGRVAVRIQSPRTAAVAIEPADRLEPMASPVLLALPAWTASEPMPMDAVESAARLMPRTTRPRTPSRAQVKVVVSDLELSTAPRGNAERPDISWLREG